MFNEGDIITTDLLNITNTEFASIYNIGDNGYGSTSRDLYFYSTRTTGDENMIEVSGYFGWNSSCNLILYRYENGDWVQKEERSGSSGWWSWSYDKGNPTSYGPGHYYWDVGLSHHQPFTFTFHTSKQDNVKGNLLAKIDDMTIHESEFFASRSYDIITTDDLNNGRVYTEIS